MLSILIPTYNYFCYTLVDDLHQQALKLNVSFEIIVADDASTASTVKIENRKINELPYCKVIELPNNIGRAKIRNLLGESAQYEYLIFMDCDASVCRTDYLKKYLDCKEEANVLIGGIANPPELNKPEFSLRYRYEESILKNRSLEEKNKKPYLQFTTFNFFISRELFLSIKFDESITEYGHEDTLFGAELEKRKISLKYIDNPLYHMGLEVNPIYLEKVHCSIKNLLLKKNKLESNSRLFILYNKLRKLHITSFIRGGFYLTEKALYKNLTGPRPNMHLFSIYKLGYFCKLEKSLKEE